MDSIVLLVIFGVAALVAAYYGIVAAENRRRALREVAERLELAFYPDADRSLDRRFSHSFFRRGHSRKGLNAMDGFVTVGGHSVHVRMGDYRYTTGSGKNRHTHRRSYAAFYLPWVGTPDLLIRKEGLGDKLAGGLGFDDIDFESEEFSRTFWVKSQDKRFAYDVIHPLMMEFLLDGSPPQVEITGDVCLLTEGRRPWDPLQFQGAIRWFETFLERWPDHLTEQLTERWGERP